MYSSRLPDGMLPLTRIAAVSTMIWVTKLKIAAPTAASGKTSRGR